MNEEITRTPETIASEIITIKKSARATLQSIATSAAVEIGKRLKEAKSLVPYGEWGEWLQTNVDYSDRTAQNLMKMAEESDRGTLAHMEELSYTQTLQLIGLPAADRDVILEENNVAELSTRELQAVIEEYKTKTEAQQMTIEQLTGEVQRMAGADAQQAEDRAADERHAREQTEAALKAAEEKAAAAKAKADKAEKEAEAAKKAKARLEEELTEARAKQTKMKESKAPAKVKEVVPPEMQKELDELRERDRRRRAADAEAAEAMKREGAEYTFRALFEQFKGDYGKLKGALEQMTPENKAKYGAALLKAVQWMAENVEG